MGTSQAYATPPHLLDNLPHWGDDFVKRVNLKPKLMRLTKWSPQWGRLSNKWGGMAYTWNEWHISVDTMDRACPF